MTDKMRDYPHELIKGIAMNILRDEMLADDACQDIYLMVLETFKGGNIGGYARTVAIHHCKDIQGYGGRRRKVGDHWGMVYDDNALYLEEVETPDADDGLEDYLDSDTLQGEYPDTRSPEEILIEREEPAEDFWLLEAIYSADLDDDQRRILELIKEGKTPEAMGKEFGCSRQAMSNRIKVIRKRVAENLNSC